MEILLINGSPKGKRSNSLRLAEKFLQGFKAGMKASEGEFSVEEIELASMNIGACKGCFGCWKNTPGVCCIKDDMQFLLPKILNADMIVWSFPLYYFNVPGMLKNMIDRQLPLILPFMKENTSGHGSGSHEARYEKKDRRNVIISTCGFYSAKDNYDSVIAMFDHFFGSGKYEKIMCGQGELFGKKEVASVAHEYLALVEKAGAEFALGSISESTHKKLEALIYPKDVFEKMADASWGISHSGEKLPDDLTFTKQMAALYNKDSYDGKDRVLEMNYTDVGSCYQILLGKDGSEVFTDGHLTATTRIDTPYEVWTAISRGEMDGAEALGKKLYTVSGDFSLMIDWNKFFGRTGLSQGDEGNGGSSDSFENKKDPSMVTMLIPWISFWVSIGINAKSGAVISMVVCALLPLVMRKRRFVIWDQLSIALVAILSAFVILFGREELVTSLGYFIFGAFWLCSCLTKEPLSASYVKYSYGGEKARRNPIFMRANYVLSVCWGILYLMTATWTFFLKRAGFGILIAIINNLVPIAMGIFTKKFVSWYPAWKARGN